MSIFQNTCKPEGFWGAFMIKTMNMGHKKLHDFGFSHVEIKPNFTTLDIGCGGGTNLKRVLKSDSTSKAYGIDYSEVSVSKSIKRCKNEIRENRCKVELMNVLDLSYPDNSFNLVTAFETIYFWSDLSKAFKNVYNTLKLGGRFLICNEANGKDEAQEKWCKVIEGMKIYKIDEIKEELVKAGFKKVEIDESKAPWIAILATK